jgi:hypothetical protein
MPKLRQCDYAEGKPGSEKLNKAKEKVKYIFSI